MRLETGDIERIAHLARLQIAPAEVEGFRESLSEILEFTEQMSGVDTGAVEPMAHPLDLVQPLRDDVVTEDDQRARFQALAPQVEAGLYLVPKVIE